MYSKDDPFSDPVVRCDDCNSMLFVSNLRADGKCGICGNRKVKNLLSLSIFEYLKMRWFRVDPKFIETFPIPKLWAFISHIVVTPIFWRSA